MRGLSGNDRLSTMYTVMPSAAQLYIVDKFYFPTAPFSGGAMQDKEYLTVLIESLQKKKGILDLLIEKNKEQGFLFADEASDPDRLEENIQEKNDLIAQLVKLDEGFQQVYDRIKTSLHGQKQQYAEEIRKMQQLIKEITDRSATIQAQEERNRTLAVKRFTAVRGNIRQARTSNQVASQYYKSMSKLNVVDSQFLDSKK